MIRFPSFIKVEKSKKPVVHNFTTIEVYGNTMTGKMKKVTTRYHIEYYGGSK